ncbi:hypothetical protein [Saccharolobus shibatae]|uniref:Uncharacterized protein n=1 Tax=Saccharolobus shibatae TaxID=2286 RepID=A0A8F5GV42_9CREN|nr:hypothetical protein [Saccharolobus shibatae]QXJ30733.1 hypothetical protein J5U21_00382 [Saccharolobus shibatae]
MKIVGNDVILETEGEGMALLNAIKANLSKKPSKEDEEEIEYALRLYYSLMYNNC